jgi:hypothetical protein
LKLTRDGARKTLGIAIPYPTKTGEATAVPLERPLTQVGFRTFAADKGQTVNDYFANY